MMENDGHGTPPFTNITEYQASAHRHMSMQARPSPEGQTSISQIIKQELANIVRDALMRVGRVL